MVSKAVFAAFAPVGSDLTDISFPISRDVMQ